MFEMDWNRRFGGLERLYGVSGCNRIKASHVMIVGVGGVGSWAAECLARSGIGRLTLVDMDHLAESNINRQVHATDETLGQSKVGAMKDRISLINPHCDIDLVDDFVTVENWESIIDAAGAVDGVIDACDQTMAKQTMMSWSLRRKMLFLSSGAAGGKRLGHLVEIDDLANVTHDPLLSRLRHRMRKDADASTPRKKLGVHCVFSREAVLKPRGKEPGDGTLNCHGYGSTVGVTATFGQCAAGWMLDRISRL